jgi:hypothetical protein
MRKTHSLLIALAFAATAGAQDAPVTVSVDNSIFSKYVWRGINLVDGPVWQPSITAASGAWSLNLWGNLELDDTNTYAAGSGRGKFTELDTTLAYSASNGDWSWSAGVIDYQFPNTGFVRTKEAFAAATHASKWNPTVRVFKDFDAADGLYGQVGVRRSLPTGDGGELAASATIGYGDEKYTSWYLGGSKAGITDAGLGLTYSKRLSQASTLSLYASYSSIPDKAFTPGSGKRDNLTFGVGVTIGF